jgi:hypothetical protein
MSKNANYIFQSLAMSNDINSGGRLGRGWIALKIQEYIYIQILLKTVT